MARKDWITVKLPKEMVEAIDRFVTTDIAHKNGIFSRGDFLTRVYSSFLANYERDFTIFGVPAPRSTSELEREEREKQEVYSLVDRNFGGIDGLKRHMKQLEELDSRFKELERKIKLD
jgi:hypothetical protein